MPNSQGLALPPVDGNWLSAATVPSVRSHPIRTAQEGAGLRSAQCAFCSIFLLVSAWRKFMLSLCLRKLAKPAGGQCLPGACRPQRPSLRAPGTMRYPVAGGPRQLRSTPPAPARESSFCTASLLLGRLLPEALVVYLCFRSPLHSH